MQDKIYLKVDVKSGYTKTRYIYKRKTKSTNWLWACQMTVIPEEYIYKRKTQPTNWLWACQMTVIPEEYIYKRKTQPTN
jgi:hypothetical protein